MITVELHGPGWFMEWESTKPGFIDLSCKHGIEGRLQTLCRTAARCRTGT